MRNLLNYLLRTLNLINNDVKSINKTSLKNCICLFISNSYYQLLFYFHKNNYAKFLEVLVMNKKFCPKI